MRLRKKAVVGIAGVVLVAAVGGMYVLDRGPFDSCGPGQTGIGAINDGGLANETVSVSGTYDYTVTVGDDGVRALKVDGETGTIPVFLEHAPDENVDFGQCLTVRGHVSRDGRRDVSGPVITGATLTSL